MPANEVLAIGMFISFIALVFTGFPVAYWKQTSTWQPAWTGAIPR